MEASFGQNLLSVKDRFYPVPPKADPFQCHWIDSFGVCLSGKSQGSHNSRSFVACQLIPKNTLNVDLSTRSSPEADGQLEGLQVLAIVSAGELGAWVISFRPDH